MLTSYKRHNDGVLYHMKQHQKNLFEYQDGANGVIPDKSHVLNLQDWCSLHIPNDFTGKVVLPSDIDKARLISEWQSKNRLNQLANKKTISFILCDEEITLFY